MERIAWLNSLASLTLFLVTTMALQIGAFLIKAFLIFVLLFYQKTTIQNLQNRKI